MKYSCVANAALATDMHVYEVVIGVQQRQQLDGKRMLVCVEHGTRIWEFLYDDVLSVQSAYNIGGNSIVCRIHLQLNLPIVLHHLEPAQYTLQNNYNFYGKRELLTK